MLQETWEKGLFRIAARLSGCVLFCLGVPRCRLRLAHHLPMCGKMVSLQVTVWDTPQPPLSRALSRGPLGLSDVPRSRYSSGKCFCGSLALQELATPRLREAGPGAVRGRTADRQCEELPAAAGNGTAETRNLRLIIKAGGLGADPEGRPDSVHLCI